MTPIVAKATVKQTPNKELKKKHHVDEELDENMYLEPYEDVDPEPDEEAEHDAEPELEVELEDSDEEEETFRKVPALSQATEQALVDFLRDHALFYDRGLSEFKNSKKKDRLFEEKAAELGLTANAIKLWYRSQRTMLGKILKKKSGPGMKALTGRQKWCYNRFGFLISHIVHRPVGSQLGRVPPPTAPLPPVPAHEEYEEPAIEIASTSQLSMKSRKPPTTPDVNELLVDFLAKSKVREELLERRAEAALTESQRERRLFMEWMLRVTGDFPEHLWREFTMETFLFVASLQKRADVEKNGPLTTAPSRPGAHFDARP